MGACRERIVRKYLHAACRRHRTGMFRDEKDLERRRFFSPPRFVEASDGEHFEGAAEIEHLNFVKHNDADSSSLHEIARTVPAYSRMCARWIDGTSSNAVRVWAPPRSRCLTRVTRPRRRDLWRPARLTRTRTGCRRRTPTRSRVWVARRRAFTRQWSWMATSISGSSGWTSTTSRCTC